MTNARRRAGMALLIAAGACTNSGQVLRPGGPVVLQASEVRVAAGGALTWCGLAVPKPGFDTQDSFLGQKDSPAPASCPALP